MSEIACAACGARPSPRGVRPWCERCGIWLVLHEPTGDWVGYAEREQRQRHARLWQHVHVSETAVRAGLRQARELAPHGWRVDAAQAAAGAWPFYLHLAPPPGSPDVTASVHPPITGHGWHVHVHDRSARIGYPLYTAGGVRAASYPELPDAIAAAVAAVRVACRGHEPDRPPPATNNTGDPPS